MASHNVKFLDTFSALPADGPGKTAHIVDHGVAGPSTAHIQDAIVTMLYNISPDILTRFMDPTVTNFKLLQRYKDTNQTDKFVIMKRDNNVVVGVVTEYPSKNTLEFDNLARLTIGQDGKWDVTYTSYRDYFAYNWEHVWTGQTVDRGLGWLNMQATPANNHVNGENLLALFPNQLSDLILYEPMWDAGRFRWVITWT